MNSCDVLNREIYLICERVSYFSPRRHRVSTPRNATINRISEIEHCMREHCLRSSESSGVICLFYAYP